MESISTQKKTFGTTIHKSNVASYLKRNVRELIIDIVIKTEYLEINITI